MKTNAVLAALFALYILLAARLPVEAAPTALGTDQVRPTATPGLAAMLSIVAIPSEVPPGGSATISVAIHRDGQSGAPVTVNASVAGATITRMASNDGVCIASRCVVTVADSQPAVVWLTVQVPAHGYASAVQVGLTADDGTRNEQIAAQIRIVTAGPYHTYLPLME